MLCVVFWITLYTMLQRCRLISFYWSCSAVFYCVADIQITVQTFNICIYTNKTLSQAVVFVYATSAHSSVTRIYDDVTNDVTGAVAEQQGDADCKQEVPR